MKTLALMTYAALIALAMTSLSHRRPPSCTAGAAAAIFTNCRTAP